MAIRSVHSTANERTELQALQRIAAELKELQRRTTAIISPSPGSGTGGNLTAIENSLNSIDSKASTELTILSDIDNNTTGLSTIMTAIDLTLDNIEVLLTNIYNLQQRENWDKLAGNSIDYSYYSGIVAGNPSGNSNLQSIIYKQGASTIFTTTYQYDANDRVINSTTV